MADSLYDALRVKPDADAGEIKRAYRKGIAKAHPDRGGDPSTALALNEAWRVLGDERLREQYDRTGRTDSAEQRAQHLAVELLTAFLGLAAHVDNVERLDLIGELRKALQRAIANHSGNINAARMKERKAESVIKRITRTRPGDNLFATGLRNMVRELERQRAKEEQAIIDKQEQLAMLDAYAYAVDEEPDPGTGGTGAFYSYSAFRPA